MGRHWVLAVILVLIFTTALFGQEETSILEAPKDWRSELIPFPLSFAPELNYEGVEDVRFLPGWSDPDSNEFWTYHFVWYVDQGELMTEERLTAELENYYDGLMRTILKQQNVDFDVDGIHKTTGLFLESDDGFRGEFRVYDAFFKKAPIELFIKVNELLCEQTNKQIVSFSISPKNFDHQVWQKFDQLKLTVPCD